MKEDIQKSLDALRESIRKLTRPPKFLVVEDNLTDIELLQKQLHEFFPKSEIAICGSGENAIEFLKKEEADAVFLDLNLPTMSGIETMKKLKEMKPPALIIVTGLSHGVESEDTLEAIKLGAVKVIAKPVTQDDLRHTFGTL